MSRQGLRSGVQVRMWSSKTHAPANGVLPDAGLGGNELQRLQPPLALSVARVGVLDAQPVSQRGSVLTAARPKARARVEVPVEDGQDAQRLLAARLPLPRALVACPDQLLQTVPAAQRVLRDDRHHDTGRPQRSLHGCRSIVAVPQIALVDERPSAAYAELIPQPDREAVLLSPRVADEHVVAQSALLQAGAGSLAAAGLAFTWAVWCCACLRL